MADEKANEKEMEKNQEKWERDPLGAVVWALILIWAGVVLLASTTGNLNIFTNILTSLGIKPYEFPIDIDFMPYGAWSVFFFGAALAAGFSGAFFSVSGSGLSAASSDLDFSLSD